MQTITKTKTSLYNCNHCYDTGYLTQACNSVHHVLYCNNCNKGRKLALNDNNTNRRIH